MRRKAAFTLVEMLAVVAIMLVLMTATFGMFGMFAEQTGPESVLSIVQAVLNGARDYAASNGVSVRVLFETTDEGNTLLDGTRMIVQRWSSADDRWEILPGRRPVELHGSMYVLNEIPGISNLAGGLPTTTRTNPKPEDIESWKKYERDVRDKVQAHAFSGSALTSRSKHNGFCIEFGPAGYPPVPGHEHTTQEPIVQEGLTVIRAVVGEAATNADSRVVSYAFYPINTNTGTRHVFE